MDSVRYQCTKCAMSKVWHFGGYPPAQGCKVAGMHSWVKADRPAVLWQCSRCGKTRRMYILSKPPVQGCSVSGMHSWIKV